jgi:hypothetical protein
VCLLSSRCLVLRSPALISWSFWKIIGIDYYSCNIASAACQIRYSRLGCTNHRVVRALSSATADTFRKDGLMVLSLSHPFPNHNFVIRQVVSLASARIQPCRLLGNFRARRPISAQCGDALTRLVVQLKSLSLEHIPTNVRFGWA